MADKKKQSIYDKRWIEKNKDHKRYLSQRSTARSFIRTKATNDDLNELDTLIDNRREELKDEII